MNWRCGSSNRAPALQGMKPWVQTLVPPKKKKRGPATHPYRPNKETWWRAEKDLLWGWEHMVGRGRVSTQLIFSHLGVQTWAVVLNRQRTGEQETKGINTKQFQSQVPVWSLSQSLFQRSCYPESLSPGILSILRRIFLSCCGNIVRWDTRNTQRNGKLRFYCMLVVPDEFALKILGPQMKNSQDT
jgi:hypothetical protein